MAIVGVAQTHREAGTINTEASFTNQHNFASPGLNVWAYAALQMVSMNDDDGYADLWISQFKDKDGPHSGKFFPGIFADKCTSITFKMKTRDCIARAVWTTEIFG